jgi:hypothetical protein
MLGVLCESFTVATRASLCQVYVLLVDSTSALATDIDADAQVLQNKISNCHNSVTFSEGSASLNCHNSVTFSEASKYFVPN